MKLVNIHLQYTTRHFLSGIDAAMYGKMLHFKNIL